jgi:hypothetical protein
MKIQQETLPLPVIDPAGDIEILTRRVAALERLVGCLLWAMAKGERRAS